MILPTTFQVNWPFSSGAEVHYCHLGFPSGVILAFLDLQVALIFPTKCLSVQETKGKINFQDGGHLGFPMGKILAIFDPQAAPILPTKF